MPFSFHPTYKAKPTAANLRNHASNLPANMSVSLFSYRVHIKRNFIKTFNWLKEKQKLLRSSVAPLAKGDVKSQTIKKRQDRKRYKRRKAKAAQESMAQRANTMILNKSDIVLNDKQYIEKNNINGKTRQSLDKLKKLVSNKVIVICKGDKDGKLLILNMSV